MKKNYEMPGEGRPPFGALHFDNAKQALLLLAASQTAWYNAQVALANLKMAVAQRLMDTALHLEEQTYTTTDLAVKVDLTRQADVLHAKVVAVLYDLERPSNDDTLSSIKVNVN
jgi:hypothetical protein